MRWKSITVRSIAIVALLAFSLLLPVVSLSWLWHDWARIGHIALSDGVLVWMCVAGMAGLALLAWKA